MEESRKLIAEFLRQVDVSICSVLRGEETRFPSAEKLLRKYQAEQAAWENHSIEHARGITEIINEMCLAKCFLEVNKGNCTSIIEYKRAIPGTTKTIDFFVKTTQGSCIYFDVKTVHPIEKNSWERYQRAMQYGYFTRNTELILDSEYSGGEIAHDLFASREKFLQYTIDFEEKIELIRDREQLFFRMVFCGDGFHWRKDHLEDFADFYRTGRHRPDDKFSSMEAHYLNEQGIVLSRTIHDFCYLQRKPPQTVPNEVVWRVRGPAIFWGDS